jgi:hypothetical protein
VIRLPPVLLGALGGAVLLAAALAQAMTVERQSLIHERLAAGPFAFLCR